jgi:hypothetical protein
VRLRCPAVLDRPTAQSVIPMGLNARHLDRAMLHDGPRTLKVTFDITILLAQKPENPSLVRPSASPSSIHSAQDGGPSWRSRFCEIVSGKFSKSR